MKKLMIAALCCMLCTSAMMAQGQRKMTTTQMNAVPVQMVADTTITNHMELTAAQKQKINELNKAFVEKVRTEMSENRAKGKRMTEEERDAFQKKSAEARKAALKELRQVMGDDKYIEYLEKSLDDMFHKSFGRGMGGHGQGGPRSGQGGRGQGGPRGGQFGQRGGMPGQNMMVPEGINQ